MQFWHLGMKKSPGASSSRDLFHFPGIAGAKKFRQIASAPLGDNIVYLLIHYVFIARHVTPGAEDADGRRKVRAVLHVRELESVRGTGMVGIVNDQIRLGDAVAELDDFEVAIGFPADALVAVFAENHWFAMFELQDMLAASVAVR